MNSLISSSNDHVDGQYAIISPTVLIRPLKLERLSSVPKVSKKVMELGFVSTWTPELPYPTPLVPPSIKNNYEHTLKSIKLSNFKVFFIYSTSIYLNP